MLLIIYPIFMFPFSFLRDPINSSTELSQICLLRGSSLGVGDSSVLRWLLSGSIAMKSIDLGNRNHCIYRLMNPFWIGWLSVIAFSFSNFRK